jgi:hypothetical protein
MTILSIVQTMCLLKGRDRTGLPYLLVRFGVYFSTYYSKSMKWSIPQQIGWDGRLTEKKALPDG